MAQNGAAPRSMMRRNLAALIPDNELSRQTKRARLAEKERQKYLKLKDENGILLQDEESALRGIDAKTGSVCLNPNVDGSIPSGEIGDENFPVMLHPKLSKVLKPHQIVGVRFMWSHIGTKNGFGCILADFMGLGKTIQVICVIHAFLSLKKYNESGEVVGKWNTALVIAPVICVRNWQAEIRKWLSNSDVRELGLYMIDSTVAKTLKARVNIAKKWHRKGGVLLMGYETYRQLVLMALSPGDANQASRISEEDEDLLQYVTAYFADPGPDLIVLDEGHRLRNHKSKLVKAFGFIKTPRRLLLTGYPLQNHLSEYWTMVNFARPEFLGNLMEFKNRFADPINNGQCKDSSRVDVLIAKKRTFVLVRELEPLVLRRDQQYLYTRLPPKKEWVLLCKLSSIQVKLYQAFLRQATEEHNLRRASGDLRPPNVLDAFHISLSISNHPDIMHHALEAFKKQEEDAKHDSDDAFIVNDHDLPIVSQNNISNPITANPGSVDDSDSSDVEITGVLSSTSARHRLEFAEPYLTNYTTQVLEHSGKMIVLFEILKECKAAGDRVTIFSQSLTSLNIVAETIYRHNENVCNRKNGMDVNKDQFNHLRIDGSVSQARRFEIITEFNDPNSDLDLVLVSTKAGGEGVNLLGGNRVVILDVCWNPSHDSQAMCRSYRFGQKKAVHIYRLISASSMEKKVYNLQVRKEGVSKRVVDDTPLERKFNTQELKNYFDEHAFKLAQQTVMEFEPIVQNGEELSLQESVELSNRMNKKQKKNASDKENKSDDESADDELPFINDDDLLEEFEEIDAKDDALDELDKAFGDDDEWTIPQKKDTANKPQVQFSATKRKARPDEDVTEEPVYDRASVRKDPVLSKVLSRVSRWLVDYYQQETMFEEDLSELCDAAEKLEAIAEFERERTQQLPHSDIPNEIMSLLHPGMEMAQRYMKPNPANFPHVMPPNLGLPSKPQYIVPQRSVYGSTPPVRYPPAPQREIRLRHCKILLIRRGIPNAEEIKARCSRFGTTFQFEVNNETTHIVSAWPQDRVMNWLGIKRFPLSVEYRPVAWLVEQLEKEESNTIRL